jgi:GTP-binding protein
MVDFVDRVKVHLKAGNGGNGCASIRREKFKPLAGPNGGNGGNGGSIYFRSTNQQTSLLDFHFSAKKTARPGEMGQGGDKDGKRGDDLWLDVPLGTIIKDLSGNVVVDMVAEGQEFMVVQGGEGGFGNARLASKQRKAPGFALKGVEGEEAELTLELKLLANVALVGFPSAGKSSIIAAISAARPKIADYPFTTLAPNLGVVSSHGFTYTVADVPGLIPGASDGKGLGLEFLRHIERTSVIAHVIDMATYEPGRDPISDFEAISKELHAYDANYNTEHTPIAKRPRIIILNKIDDLAARDLAELAAEEFRARGEEVFLASASTHEGLKDVTHRLGELVQEGIAGVDSTADLGSQDEYREVIKLTPLKRKTLGSRNEFSVKVHGSGENAWYEVIGEKLRRWVLQTDFANDEAVGYLADRLAKIGVEDELAKLGATPGAEVRIAIKATRESYLISDQEYYVFSYEPDLMAGAEVLYSNRRGEDTRLDYEDRSQRATRKEKREAYHARQDERSQTRDQFTKEREQGYWADPQVHYIDSESMVDGELEGDGFEED